MNKSKMATIFGSLCFLVSAIMYQVGSTNGHLTELKDLFFVPLPLGIVAILYGLKTKNE